MAEPTISQERSSGDAGLADHLRALAASAVGYFQARFHLAGIESREAAGHYLKILLWLAAGIAAVAFGYVFFCCALVFILAQLLNVSWMWIMLGLGLAHFAAAVVCAVIIRDKFPKPMFEATLNEFKKDQEWLTPPSKPN
ncbi:MAG: phage holin family protein [Verrucomicrobiota bacterium]